MHNNHINNNTIINVLILMKQPKTSLPRSLMYTLGIFFEIIGMAIVVIDV